MLPFPGIGTVPARPAPEIIIDRVERIADTTRSTGDSHVQESKTKVSRLCPLVPQARIRWGGHTRTASDRRAVASFPGRRTVGPRQSDAKHCRSTRDQDCPANLDGTGHGRAHQGEAHCPIQQVLAYQVVVYRNTFNRPSGVSPTPRARGIEMHRITDRTISIIIYTTMSMTILLFTIRRWLV